MWFITDRGAIRMAVAVAAAALAALLTSGCLTTESDLPWNTPQSWEGSPTMPGMSSGGVF